MMKRWLRILILSIGFASLMVLTNAQTGVRIVVVNEHANVRVIPAIGADVLGTVSAGYEFPIVTARSADFEWVRVDFTGSEGWVNLAPAVVLSGDINSLPVADPRTIPYGGFGSPRAGVTNQTSGPMTAIATNGVRLRAGPSQGYPTLLNIFAKQQVIVTGRTASRLWYQVIHEGVLGWAFSSFLQFNSPGDANSLPVDGIVADGGPPPSQPTADDYLALLRLMLARIDIAQESLNQIRASWTDSALTGRASCHAYPPRPSNINIAIPLLAAFFDRLDPLQRTFNDAMTNTRHAIDLFIEVCNQPGTGNPVGTATVQGALDTINLAESQYVRVRTRLLELLPPDRVPGADECVLSYNAQVEILPLLQLSTIYADSATPRDYTTGYCFDALEGSSFRVQVLQIPGSNLVPFISISPLDNPTNFIGVARANGSDPLTVLSPIPITRTTRYLIIISDIGGDNRTEAPQGQFALMVSNITGSTVQPTLFYNPATGSVEALNNVPSTAGTTDGTTPPTGGTTDCQAFTECATLFTCAEAFSCLQAGNFSLDTEDGVEDGIPCGNTLCLNQ